MTRVAIVVGSKGRGSNMRAIVSACQDGRLPARVVCVVCPKETPATAFAAAAEIPIVIPDDFGAMSDYRPDLVCLAGYMRLVPHEIVAQYEDRMLNIHPALLPKFGGKGMWGMAVHEAVLAAGERESGCTVHFVSEHYDEGNILLQMKCNVDPAETPESLAAKVLKLEHECYVQAIAMWIRSRSHPE